MGEELIQIQKQYQRIPTFTCKNDCTECCGPVPFSEAEWARLTPEEQSKPLTSTRCQFVSPDGCTIYNRRPLLCRLFGNVNDERLLCWHGCRPDQLLTKIQGLTIMRHYLKQPLAQDPLQDMSWLKNVEGTDGKRFR